MNSSQITTNVWFTPVLSYSATETRFLNLTFHFNTNNKDIWFLDDVTLRNSNLTNLLSNGDFQSSGSSGWNTQTFSCAEIISGSTDCQASTGCYKHGCNGQLSSVSQSFNAIAGDSYSLTFSFRLKDGGAGGNANPVIMYVTIN